MRYHREDLMTGEMKRGNECVCLFVSVDDASLNWGVLKPWI